MERNTYRGDGAVLSSRGLNPRSGVRSREVLDGSVHGEQPETEDGLCEKVEDARKQGFVRIGSCELWSGRKKNVLAETSRTA